MLRLLASRYNTKLGHSGLGNSSPNELERRTAATARQAHGDARGREPRQIGRPAIHNHPLGGPSTPVSERELLPSAIAHLRASGDSPQPTTETKRKGIRKKQHHECDKGDGIIA